MKRLSFPLPRSAPLSASLARVLYRAVDVGVHALARCERGLRVLDAMGVTEEVAYARWVTLGKGAAPAGLHFLGLRLPVLTPAERAAYDARMAEYDAPPVTSSARPARSRR